MATTELSNMTEHEAFAGIIWAATAVDGYIADEELTYLHRVFSRMHLFHGWNADRHRRLFHRLNVRLKADGVESLLDAAIAALPPKYGQTAFTIAVDLVLADGVVTESEKDFLYQLQHKLEIPDDLAKKIMEVIIIKNRG